MGAGASTFTGAQTNMHTVCPPLSKKTTALQLSILLANKRGDWTKGVIQVLPVKWRSSNTNKSATRANFSSNFETCESLRVELLHASIRIPKFALIAKLSVWKD